MKINNWVDRVCKWRSAESRERKKHQKESERACVRDRKATWECFFFPQPSLRISRHQYNWEVLRPSGAEEQRAHFKSAKWSHVKGPIVACVVAKTLLGIAQRMYCARGRANQAVRLRSAQTGIRSLEFNFVWTSARERVSRSTSLCVLSAGAVARLPMPPRRHRRCFLLRRNCSNLQWQPTRFQPFHCWLLLFIALICF